MNFWEADEVLRGQELRLRSGGEFRNRVHVRNWSEDVFATLMPLIVYLFISNLLGF